MAIEPDIKILQETHIDRVHNFEMDRLALEIEDEMDRNLHAWSARWRKESLEHYSSTGWSFVAFDPSDDSKVLGYFLGQALVFFQGQTQVLWIEKLTAANQTVEEALIEVAYRWARDKHLQRVVFSEANAFRISLEKFKGYAVESGLWEIKTTKG